ncbi:ABC transporter permease [Streptomyces sp. Agncl-13]|uniref:ABC transporter permease n=1 Tax=Streptomyces sp. Agncl-13 TaxID=3400628 RepID=UPI003A889C19
MTAKNSSLLRRLADRHGYAAVPVSLLVCLLALAAVRGPHLFTSDGAAYAIVSAAPLIMATMALTPVAMAGRGGVDLAIGPLVGFVNVSLVFWLIKSGVTSPLLIIAFAIGVSVLFEVVQGLLIAGLRLQPVIVTLSGFLVLAGVNLMITDKPDGMAPAWLTAWGAPTSVFSPVTGVLVAGFVVWTLIARTSFFHNLRVMGFNERTAFASGVPLVLTRVGAHAIAGVYAGLAGVLYTAVIASGDPAFGQQYTLIVVTALLLGGISVGGGRGGALGAVVGAIDVFLISDALATFDFGAAASFVVQLVYGLILVLALAVGTVFTRSGLRRRRRHGRVEVLA